MANNTGSSSGSSSDFTSMQHTITGILYIVTALFGVIGNLYVFKTIKKGKILDSPKNILHLNLAVAHIGVILPGPMTGASHLARKWLFGDIGCQAYAFTGFFFGLAAIGLLVCLAFERYYIHCFEAFEIGPKGFKGMAAVAWGVALFWSVAPFLGWSRYKMEPSKTTCSIDWMSCNEDNTKSYMTALITCNFMLAFMLIIYFLGMAAANYFDEGPEKGKMDEAQVTKFTVSMVICAAVSWSPYALLCMSQCAGPKAVSTLQSVIPPLAAKIGMTLVPLLYSFTSPAFCAVCCPCPSKSKTAIKKKN